MGTWLWGQQLRVVGGVCLWECGKSSLLGVAAVGLVGDSVCGNVRKCGSFMG